MRSPLVAVACLLGAVACAANPHVAPKDAVFSVTSAEMQDGGELPMAQVFDSYGCTGSNLSPSLAWHNAPDGTQSFAVTVVDPDAQDGAGLVHWLVYDIPVTALELPTGAGAIVGAGTDAGTDTGENAGAGATDGASASLPRGAVAGANSFGMNGYAGACPPVGAGAHHYTFTVYALRVDHFAAQPSQADIEAQAVSSASLTVTYAR